VNENAQFRFFYGMAWLTLAVAFLFLDVGCAHRENARATMQAQQAIVGTKAVLDSMPADARASIAPYLAKVDALLAGASRSLDPVVAVLTEGTPVQTKTSAQQASADTDTFLREQGIQTGKAESEAQGVIAAAQLWSTVGGVVQQATGSWWTQLLVPGGGIALAVGAAIKAISASRAQAVAEDELDDQAAYGQKMTRLAEKHAPSEAVAAIKNDHPEI
jgi:hypothetical protein